MCRDHFWFVFRARWWFIVGRQWNIVGNVSSSDFVQMMSCRSNKFMTIGHLAVSCLWSMRRHHRQRLFAAYHTCSGSNRNLSGSNEMSEYGHMFGSGLLITARVHLIFAICHISFKLVISSSNECFFFITFTGFKAEPLNLFETNRVISLLSSSSPSHLFAISYPSSSFFHHFFHKLIHVLRLSCAFILFSFLAFSFSFHFLCLIFVLLWLV